MTTKKKPKKLKRPKNAPLDVRYTTPAMERLALDLGAYNVTVWSWRRRGVPLAWQIRLHQESNGRIKLTDFERPPYPVN